MIKGTVKWFDAAKGFGFILMQDGKELFVHYTAINSSGHKTLEQGQNVSFDITEGNRGAQACNVTVI